MPAAKAEPEAGGAGETAAADLSSASSFLEVAAGAAGEQSAAAVSMTAKDAEPGAGGAGEIAAVAFPQARRSRPPQGPTGGGAAVGVCWGPGAIEEGTLVGKGVGGGGRPGWGEDSDE
mmetsp:Transcript_8644/g.22732  ORF Transcript_8644/g.22732 Transcript_8644/m.22732 type:complete len:118 (-) Transcript_8644:225-578(-)